MRQESNLGPSRQQETSSAIKRLATGMDRHHRWLVIFGFACYLAIGMLVFGDYGVHFDEYHNQKFGNRWGHYVDTVMATGHIPDGGEKAERESSYLPIKHHTLCHGPFWELVLYYSQKAFLPAQADVRDIILLRHLATFLLFFAASGVFYRICMEVFGNWKLSVLGVCLLVTQPRIFADSFYNSVDLPFLSFYIFTMYTFIRFMDKPNNRSALWHAVACALLVDIRAAGLIVPALTVLGFGWRGLQQGRKYARRSIGLLMVYGAYFTGVMLLFWPFLWEHTIPRFIASIRGGIFNYPIVPVGWYNPLWIVATTPPAYVILFIVGFLTFLGHSLASTHRRLTLDRNLWIAGWLWLVPLAAPIIAGSALYNGWRHHYFVYPPMVLFCLLGLRSLLKGANCVSRMRMRHMIRTLLIAFPVTAVGTALNVLVHDHPFQFAYANAWATGRFALYAADSWREGSQSYQQDYWSVSARQALEYILAHDHRTPLVVYFWNPYHLGRLAFDILPAQDRARLLETKRRSDADYLIGDINWLRPSLVSDASLAAAISVEDIPITPIYVRESRQTLGVSRCLASHLPVPLVYCRRPSESAGRSLDWFVHEPCVNVNSNFNPSYDRRYGNVWTGNLQVVEIGCCDELAAIKGK